jgi:hypothetical protein
MIVCLKVEIQFDAVKMKWVCPSWNSAKILVCFWSIIFFLNWFKNKKGIKSDTHWRKAPRFSLLIITKGSLVYVDVLS